MIAGTRAANVQQPINKALRAALASEQRSIANLESGRAEVNGLPGPIRTSNATNPRKAALNSSWGRRGHGAAELFQAGRKYRENLGVCQPWFSGIAIGEGG